jgi:ABC-type lipoprotein export system ATPase subunit
MQFKIEQVGVNSREDWDKIIQQLLPIWQTNGSNEKDQPPMTPKDELFQFQHKEENQVLIRHEWKTLIEWIERNGCTIQQNGKVALWPKPVRTKPIVNPENPYANDTLNRNQKIGNLIIQLISIQTEPLVLALNGPWGSGKTTLLDMWRPEAEKTFSVVHFNAWETDYAKDPLVALIAEMKEALGKTVPEVKMRDLLRAGAGVAFKVLSAGMLSASDLSPEEMKEKGQKHIEESLAEYEGAKKLLATFRKRLEVVAAEVEKKPLVFVIDELDRCRPTYAIELLERIKHLFAVKGVCFVLAVDKEQLGEAIKAVYGNIHTEGYLRRFIDLTYTLPKPSADDYIQQLMKETHLAHYLQRRNTDDGAVSWTQKNVSYLASILNFSLRDIEHIIRQISLAARTTPCNSLLSPLVLSTLACLKCYDEHLYRDFCTAKIGADQVLQKLPPLLPKEEYSNDHQCAEAALRFSDQVVTWRKWAEGMDNKEVPHITGRIADWHNSYDHLSSKNIAPYCYEKLEILQPLIG